MGCKDPYRRLGSGCASTCKRQMYSQARCLFVRCDTPRNAHHVTVAWALIEQSSDSPRRAIETACVALGLAPPREVAHLCPRCGSGGHGRPFAPGRSDLCLSLTRTSGVVAAAVGTGLGVGIDVERVDGARWSGLGDAMLHPDETASSIHDLAVTWTRKEAVLKALGVGLSLDPRNVQLGPAAEAARVLALPAGYEAARMRLLDLVLSPTLVGALAVIVEGWDREVSVVAAVAGRSREAKPGRGR